MTNRENLDSTDRAVIYSFVMGLTTAFGATLGAFSGWVTKFYESTQQLTPSTILIDLQSKYLRETIACGLVKVIDVNKITLSGEATEFLNRCEGLYVNTIAGGGIGAVVAGTLAIASTIAVEKYLSDRNQ